MNTSRPTLQSGFAVALIVLSLSHGLVSAQSSPQDGTTECVVYTAPAQSGFGTLADDQADGETNDDAQPQAQATDDHADGETNDDGQDQTLDDHADGETNDDVQAQATDDHADGETNDDVESADSDIDATDEAPDPSYVGSLTVDAAVLNGLTGDARCAKLTSLATVTAEQAKAAAPAGATVLTVGLDVENGFLVYSLQLADESELTVDAGTGDVLATQPGGTDAAEPEATPAASANNAPASV